jgi:hypothetical protein
LVLSLEEKQTEPKRDESGGDGQEEAEDARQPDRTAAPRLLSSEDLGCTCRDTRDGDWGDRALRAGAEGERLRVLGAVRGICVLLVLLHRKRGGMASSKTRHLGSLEEAPRGFKISAAGVGEHHVNCRFHTGKECSQQ